MARIRPGIHVTTISASVEKRATADHGTARRGSASQIAAASASREAPGASGAAARSNGGARGGTGCAGV